MMAMTYNIVNDLLERKTKNQSVASSFANYGSF